MPASRWSNRSEEDRLRCRATEIRTGRRRQCTEDRRGEHVHQWRGIPFENQDRPESYTPTLAPTGVKRT